LGLTLNSCVIKILICIIEILQYRDNDNPTGAQTPMTLTFSEILLWLFVIDLSIAFGAGLYEHRIILPQWFSGSLKTGLRVNSEAMRRTDTGPYVTTVPLTLLTLASLVLARQTQGALRGWWLTAAVFALMDRIGTFSFFIPKALKLMRADPLPDSRTAAMASLWMRLNRVSLAFGLAGWLAALKAFSLVGAGR
jgi:hypothetical protein